MRFSKTVVITILSIAALLGLAALNLRVFPNVWSSQTGVQTAWKSSQDTGTTSTLPAIIVVDDTRIETHQAPKAPAVADVVPPTVDSDSEPSKEEIPTASESEEDVQELFAPIYFAAGDHELAQTDSLRLRRIAQFLNQNERHRLVITGYSTPGGSSRYNQFLAKQRARALRDELLTFGIARRRVKINSIVFAKREMYGQTSEEAHRAEFQLKEQ